jgi:hypothetical protein
MPKIKPKYPKNLQTALGNINEAVDAYVEDLDYRCLQDEISEDYLEEKMQEIHKSLDYITEIVKKFEKKEKEGGFW